MLTATIQAVVFDAVGTMIHPQPPAAQVYAVVGRYFGSQVSEKAIAARFAAAFRLQEERDRRSGLQTSEAREQERWRLIVGQVLDDATDGEACFQELFDHFSRPTAWQCDAEGATVLAELKQRGYLLGLASNYDRRLRTVAAGLPGLRPLDHLVISSEVGWRKPAPGFFAGVAAAFTLPPARILFVGDDLENDYRGARTAGLQAVLYDPRESAPPSVRRIGRFRELLG
jgi:putative hydrolase of the HAD superfamily